MKNNFALSSAATSNSDSKKRFDYGSYIGSWVSIILYKINKARKREKKRKNDRES